MQPDSHDDIDVATAAALVADGAVLLDVRTLGEWQAGHAPGATHLELQTLPSRVGELPADKKVAVICKVGGRSAQAAAFLQGSGFDAVNVAGGMVQWAHAGLPVTSETTSEPAIL